MLHKASGDGRVTIQTNNSYTGATTINAGTISIASDGASAGNSAPLGAVPTLATPGNIVLNGGALNASAAFTLHANRGVALGPTTGTGTGTIDVDSGYEFIVAGVIDNNGASGTGNLNKTGLGTLTLNAANTFSGTTTIAGGTLRLGNANALQNSILNYNYPGGTGGTISFGALTGTQTVSTSGYITQTGVVNIAGLTGAQDLTLANDTSGAVFLQVGGNNLDSTYSGALSGGGSLAKIGTGTLTLTGNSYFTYTGATFINQGNIVVSGSGVLNTGAAMHVSSDGIGGGATNGTLTFMNSAGQFRDP